MATIKLGYAPTRRSIFSAPDAIKYRGLTDYFFPIAILAQSMYVPDLPRN